MKTTSTDHRRVIVTVYDPVHHRSRSLTVYCADLDPVAEAVQHELCRRWSTTSLRDRRHKRGL